MTGQDGAPTSLLSQRLDGLSAAERYAVALDIVRSETATLIGREKESLDPEQAYRDYGYNSMAAVLLTDMLSQATGLELPLTMLFDHPNPAAVARYLVSRVTPPEPVAAPEPRAVPEDDDPVAVVGMACRFPGGASSPEGLWRLVESGVDAITGFPADRGWDLASLFDPDPERPGTSHTRSGGFLPDAAEFDAEFFGIGPREALAMDPQQRLLLEGVWEAFENAGLDPTSLRGSDTGVFVGACTSDYSHLSRSADADLDGYWAIGSAGSVASGRVAYSFGLVGPALTVDTACSSSLVAVHLAAQSVRRGECSMAVAGGVAVNATPSLFVEFSRQQALSPDGRCRSFSADADGTGWSEGMGVLVLERLSDARRLGHRVLAVVRGSAVNQDGASNGLTAPNGPSQERVIRAALADAGLTASDVDAVEAHGTGTVLGDPIEAQALLATYGQGRPEDRPLWLGSLKSNIGHSQAASGTAGVIKMIMAMRRGRLPATLHVDTPTPKVDWSAGRVELLTEARDWRVDGRPRRAGVSAFGASGTNAHVILEEAPPHGEPAATNDSGSVPVVWVVSGRSRSAVLAQVRRLREWVPARPGCDPVDVAWSLLRRARFDHRVVVVGASRDELVAGLGAVLEGRDSDRVVVGEAVPSGRVAFVFPGQGAQWQGMAVGLLDSAPVFADRMRDCAEALAPYVEWSLFDVVHGVEGAPGLDRVDVVQPVLFAVMVSLAALWESYGVRPDGVVGHSQGEIAAACVAGALSLDDAARVVAVRSRLLLDHTTGNGGAMMSVAEPADEVRDRLDRWPGSLWIAAENGPSATTVTGARDALADLAAECESENVWTRTIPVDYASHSPHVESLRQDLLDALAAITPQPASTPFHTTVNSDGDTAIDTTKLDAEYWYRNLREPVHLHQAVRTMLDAGYTTFIEVSPHPVLNLPLEQTAEARGRASVFPTLRRDAGSLTDFLAAIAHAHAAGTPVDWAPLFGERAPRQVDLPGYAFEHERFWIEPSPPPRPAAAGMAAAGHPLLAGSILVAGGSGGRLFTGEWSLSDHPWMADHAVFGHVVVAGAALAELAARVGERVGRPVVRELTLHAPLILPDDSPVTLQVWVGKPDGDCELTIHSRVGDAEDEWVQHASGVLTADAEPAGDFVWLPEGAVPVPVDGLYDSLAERGFGYGPVFRGLRAAWRHDGALYAEIEPTSTTGFAVHPATIDAAFHAVLTDTTDDVVLPFAWSGVWLRPGGTGSGPLRVRLTPLDGEGVGVGMVAVDTGGRPVMSVAALSGRPVSRQQLDASRTAAEPLYAVEWVDAGVPTRTPSTVAVLGTTTVSGPDIRQYQDLAALLSDVDDGATVPEWVVLPVMPPAVGEVPDRVRENTGRVLAVLRDWLAHDQLVHTRLAVLTSGAVALDGEAPDIAVSPVWGLVRSAQSENPDRFALLDVGAPTGQDLRAALALAATEPQIAVRDGRLRVPRLTRSAAQVGAAALAPEGTVLVTGGTSGIGAVVARHLVVEHGVRHLLLTSRRGPAAPGVDQLVDDLTGLGARVEVRACDVADRDQLAALLDGIPAEHPLRGVVHSAAVLRDATVPGLTESHLHDVLAAKADAAWHLHELTEHLPLAAFVLFSSISGTLGGPGQGNYAAANTFLDALAHHRHAHGLPATSLAWGYWQHTTELTGQLTDTDTARLAAQGIRPLPTATALRHFDVTLAAAGPHYCPTSLATAGLTRATTPPILHGLLPATASGKADADRTTAPNALREHLAGLSGQQRHHHLQQHVLATIAGVLGHKSPAGVQAATTFKNLGFDSLSAVQLRNQLSRGTGLTLPPTLVFDHPTPQALTAHLLDLLHPGAPADPAEDDAELLEIDAMSAEALVSKALQGD